MDHEVKRVPARLGRASVYAVAALAAVMTGLSAAAPAAAQVRGLPVYNSGVPRGIGISGEIGLPNEDAGKGLGYGVTGSAGIGLLGVTATVGAFNPDGPAGAKAVVGGTVNYRMFGGPLIPLAVTLQGGVGYHKPDVVGSKVTDLHVPIGVGFALTIPNPAVAIKPWIAPRVDVSRSKVEALGVTSTSTDTRFGISGGVELNLLNGLGFHAAYDLVTGDNPKPGVLGLGLHYAMRLPVP